jgi:hypothetical protein
MENLFTKHLPFLLLAKNFFEATCKYSCMRLREWKCCFRIDSIEIQRNLVQAKVVVYTVN